MRSAVRRDEPASSGSGGSSCTRFAPAPDATFALDSGLRQGQAIGAMRDPTAEQLACLERFERFAFRISHEVNRRPLLKRAAHVYLRGFGAWWVERCTRSLLHVDGLDHVLPLRPDRGVVLACNHRSFFDLYVVSSVLLRHTRWIERMYFPVRSSYFYERPDGIAVNMAMSALAMYPPILRSPAKRAFNQFAVAALTEFAARRGSVVGVHPEGTRSKTDDPYTLLPAQPGIGEIIRAARPIVLPAFVLGLSNDIVSQVRGNFDGTGEPITMVFGAPLELGELLEAQPRLRTYKRIADRVREAISALGERERQLRIERGFPSKEPRARTVPTTSAAA